MKKTAAFFDVDGTISREGLIGEMFRKMIKYELIDVTKWHEEVKPAFSQWNRRIGDYDNYLMKMVDIYSDTVKDSEAFLIEHIARKVIEQNGERVYTYSRERIKWHQEQGHLVIAISGSPVELVREMARKYGMDDYKGTVYEVGSNGIYNGIIVPMWDSESKRSAVLEMAQKHELDLSESYAYGDTTGDFSMMKLVGRPFAVNPTKELIGRILQDPELKQTISVIVERKDVTYKIGVESLEIVD